MFINSKVLIIGEDSFIVSLISSALNKENIRSLTADKTDNALDLALLVQPDIVICETTAVYNVLELFEKFSYNKKTAAIPFLVITFPDMSHQYFSSGVDGIILKPLCLPDLLMLVKKKLTRINIAKSKDEMQTRDIKQKLNADSTIFLTNTQKALSMILVKDISAIEADGVFSKIHTKDQTFTKRKSLKEWMSLLPEDKFLQINRQQIINIEYILSVEKKKNVYSIHLTGYKETFNTSKRYSQKIRAKLNI